MKPASDNAGTNFHKGAAAVLKAAVALLVVFVTLSAFLSGADKVLKSKKTYDGLSKIESQLEAETSGAGGITGSAEVRIHSKGNKLGGIRFCLKRLGEAGEVKAGLYAGDGSALKEWTLDASELSEGWNSLDAEGVSIERGGEYAVRFTLPSGTELLSVWECPSSDLFDEGLEKYPAVGVTMDYEYVEPAGVMYFAVSLVIYLFYALVLAFAAWNAAPLYAAFKRNRSWKSFFYALYMAVTMARLINPLSPSRTKIASFIRQMGQGVVSDYDAPAVAGSFMKMFAVFAVFLALFYLVCNGFSDRAKDGRQKAGKAFLDTLIGAGLVDLVLKTVIFFQDGAEGATVFYYSTSLIALLSVVMIIYVYLGGHKGLSPERLHLSLLFILTSSFAAALISGLSWEDGKLTLGIQALMALALVIFMYRPVRRGRLGGGGQEDNTKLRLFVMIASAMPLLSFCFIEGMHVLNRNSVFVASPRKLYVVFCAVFYAAAAGAALLYRKKEGKKQAVRRWEGVSHALAVLGIAALSMQVPLQMTFHADIYESSNYASPIGEFLRFSSIPFVDMLPHHMLTYVLEGLAYAFLNHDYTGAIISPYQTLVQAFYSIFFYVMVSRMLKNKKVALLAALVLPFSAWWLTFAMGALACFAAASFVKKNTWKGAAVMWLSMVWCALYRIDIGLSFGVGCTAAVFIYMIAERKWDALKKAVVTLAAVGAGGVLLWCVLCLLKGYDPVSRLIEFLRIFSSDYTWAYSSMGDTSKVPFAYLYVIIPFVMLASVLYVCFVPTFRQKVGDARWCVFMALGLSYFANFARGVTRHNLVEFATNTITWVAYVYLAMLLACILGRARWFMAAFILLMLVNKSICSTENMRQFALIDGADAAGTVASTWTLGRFAGESGTASYEIGGQSVTLWQYSAATGTVFERVSLESDMQAKIDSYVTLFGTLLENDETFADFTGQSFVYPAAVRKLPVYGAQAPLMLTGQESQEEYISEIVSNADKTPIVLMPNMSGAYISIDGVQLAYKYYKVAEYIYQNYRPLLQGSNYSVWCENSRYDELYPKAAQLIEANPDAYSFADWGYDGAPYLDEETGEWTYPYLLHRYDAGEAPRLWGEADKKNASENDIVRNTTKLAGRYAFAALEDAEKAEGDYIKVTLTYSGTSASNASEKADAVLALGTREGGSYSEKYRFNFKLLEGTHTYLFRVSCDYYWYSEEIDACELICGEPVSVAEVSVLNGD